MNLSLMVNFIFNKLFLLIFFFGCAEATYSQSSALPPPFIHHAEGGLVYDTEVIFGKHQLSGLTVLREEDEGYHVMLLTKVGFTLSEFIITPQEVIWIKEMPGSEKKLLKKVLEEDFRLLLLTALQNPEKVKQKRNNIYQVKKNIRIQLKVSEDSKRVDRAETKAFINPFKGFATFFYNGNDIVPEKIVLTRRWMKAKIQMNRMNP